MNRARRRIRIVSVVIAAAVLLLTACEERIATAPAPHGCPGPDAISANGRWILTSPPTPGPVHLRGRGSDAGTNRHIFAEGYGTAVNADGTVVTAFSRRADSGVIWRRATGEHTVLPIPDGSTVAIPTSISDDGRHVGVTAAAVPGGPMSGHVYDAVTRTLTPLAGAENITQLVLTRSGRYAYVAGTDGTIRRIDRTTGASRTVATVSPQNPEPIESVTRLGRLVVYNSAPDNRDGKLRMWDGNTGRSDPLPAPFVDGVAFDRVDISGDGKVLAATVFGSDRTAGDVVRVTVAGGKTTELAAVTDAGRSVISADGVVIAYCRPVEAGSTDRDVYAWIHTG